VHEEPITRVPHLVRGCCTHLAVTKPSREAGTLAEVNSNYSMATGTTIIDPSSSAGGDDRLLTMWLPILIAALASAFGICVGWAPIMTQYARLDVVYSGLCAVLPQADPQARRGCCGNLTTQASVRALPCG
jgi:hypothetical protein